MNKNKRLIILIIVILLFIVLGIIFFINKSFTDYGSYKDGKVIYSDKIVKTKAIGDKKTIEIKSVYKDLDNLTFTSANLEDLRSNRRKYNQKLKDAIKDDSISNKDIYNIDKAILLGLIDEDKSLIDYYVSITGLKNKNDFVHFCKNTFKLMDKESKDK